MFELLFGPNDESIYGEVMLFEPPTELSIDVSNSTSLNNDFDDTGYSVRMTFLGDGILRATNSTARIGEHAGSADTINFVGSWYNLQRSKDEAAERRRREQELDYKHESHPTKTDGLKHWNDSQSLVYSLTEVLTSYCRYVFSSWTILSCVCNPTLRDSVLCSQSGCPRD
jgi:hypothetical protein